MTSFVHQDASTAPNPRRAYAVDQVEDTGGHPSLIKDLGISIADTGVCSLGFRTQVQPVAYGSTLRQPD